MLCGILRTSMRPGEQIDVFVRRRHRAVGAQARRLGLWSQRHFNRVLDWQKHLQRLANASSWAAKLLQFRGFDWLCQQCALYNEGIFAGRTGTRVSSGNVATRWHDGARFAAASVPSYAASEPPDFVG